MKCPKCKHESGALLLRCSACGEAYESKVLEKLGHLEYLLSWLDERVEALGSEVHAQVRAEASGELSETLGRIDLGPAILAPETVEPEPVMKRPVEEIAHALNCLDPVLDHVHEWGKTVSLSVSEEIVSSFRRYILRHVTHLKNELQGQDVEVMPPGKIEVINYALEMMPTWSEELDLEPPITVSFVHYLKQKRAELLKPEEPTPVPLVQPEPVEAIEIEEVVVEKPVPEVPLQPAFTLPKFDWAKWWERTWEFVTSGAALRGLLYLGAFMIVVSAAVLVVRFWDIFPEVVQLLFIASVPTIFYLAGWGVRTRLKLPQAGGVLSGIGALLVAIDFAAVYQFGGLEGRVDLTTYWLGASLICTLIYTFSAWRLPTEFFGYITIVGAGSTLLAITEILGFPLQWQIVAMGAFGTGLVETAVRLGQWKEEWESLSRAGWRSAHVFLVGSLVAVLFVPGDISLAQMITFLISTIGFGLFAKHSMHAIYAHVAIWNSLGVFAFLFILLKIPNEWAGTAAGLVVVLYGLGRMGAKRFFEEESKPWDLILAALSYVHWTLIGLSVIAGLLALRSNVWAGVIALTLSSLLLGWSAILYRSSMMILPAAVVFIGPVTISIWQWLTDFEIDQVGAWLMVGWAGLAIIYLGIAAALRKHEEHVRWLNLVAHSLAPAGLIGLIFNFLLASEDWFTGPTLVALAGIIIVYLASVLIHDSDKHPALSAYLSWLPDLLRKTIFLWPIGLLIPIWMSIAWLGSVLEPSWLGAALSGLGLVYVGLGQVLAQRERAYRLVPHAYAYPLVIVGIIAGLGDKWALLTALYLAVAVFVALAAIYRRAWESGIAALLFIWPFQLSLVLSPLTTHAYSLAYALLATLAYIPLGILLDKKDRKFALPLYVVGYALSIAAVATSFLGRFGVYEMDVPWLGAVPPLIVAGLMVFSTRQFANPIPAWAAAVIFPIVYGQTLTLFQIPSEYFAVAWVGLAIVYMAVERWIHARIARRVDLWYRSFRAPLVVGVATLTTIGLALTVFGTFRIFFGVKDQDHLPLILAQAFAVGLTATATRLYHNRWLLYISAALSFFPTTLAWMGYGPAITTAQYSWVWTGLSGVLLAIGFLLDRSKERYAHGPYFVGYTLSIFALGWSTQDRHTNLYTLGAFLLLSVISQVVVHRGRHHSFNDLIGFIWRRPGTVAWRIARTGFLFIIAIGFPIWLIQLLTYHNISLAWKGLALALTAPLYIAMGLLLKRMRSEYAWPFYGMGYLLTAIGAMVAFDDPLLAIYVLGLDAVVYVVSAYIFRQAFWLYLSNVLLPVIVILTLNYNESLTSSWLAGSFMGLAFLYFALGFLFNQRKDATQNGVGRFALPFFVPSYVLSAVALAAASSEKMLAIGIFSSGVLFYGLSAWAFREAIFLYPTAWLVAVPYYLGMTLVPLDPRWYGIGWLPLIVGFIAMGRFVFQKTPLGITKIKTFLHAFLQPAMPFYLLAYGLSASMMLLSRNDTGVLTLAFAAGSILYFSSAALFRHALWLYPALLTTHTMVVSLYDLIPFDLPLQYITLPFLLLTWVLAWVGKGFADRFPIVQKADSGKMIFKLGERQIDFSEVPWIGHLLVPSWAQPFFLFVAVDIILWQVLAMGRLDTAILLGAGNAILLGIFAMIWRDLEITYSSIGFFLVAVGARLWWTGMHYTEGLAWFAGIGFGLYIVAILAEDLASAGIDGLTGLRVWEKPLTYTSVFLTAIAVLVTLPQVRSYGVPATAALGFAGILYLAIAYRGRHIRLSYLGLALLELDWALMLIDQEIKQPQFYAIPAGLYFVLVGFLERRQGRKLFATILEGFGLAVLVVTSFIQSIHGVEGFPYFLLLLVEGLLVIWWGIAQRRKIPFFIGIGASVLNVVSQVVVLINVYDVQRWIIILGVGVLLVTAAIFVERQRERIITQMQEWREELETWE
jgi:hypothetical protein